jgi:hypothetical protein
MEGTRNRCFLKFNAISVINDGFNFSKVCAYEAPVIYIRKQERKVILKEGVTYLPFPKYKSLYTTEYIDCHILETGLTLCTK